MSDELREAPLNRRAEDPPRWQALIAALAIGAAFTYFVSVVPVAGNKTDLAPIYWSARALLDGADPYAAVGPNGSYYRFDWEQLYPLTAILFVLPLAFLSYETAATIFSGLSVAVLAYAVARDGYRRLPAFLSAAAIVAVMLSQWSPLLTAAVLLPPLGFLLAVKPTIGLALFLYRPTTRAALGAALLVMVSLAVMPSWPMEWLQRIALNQPEKIMPVMTYAGPLLLLAFLRWKRPEARLLLALSFIPQTLWDYEMLPLFLLASSVWEALILAAVTWIAYHLQLIPIDAGMSFMEKHAIAAQLNVGLVYVTALLMLLRRPNEGDTPELVAAVRRRLADLAQRATRRWATPSIPGPDA